MSIGAIPYTPMPRTELEALILAAQGGDIRARDRVLMQTLRLVTLEVHRYARRYQCTDAIDDLTQVACVGASDGGAPAKGTARASGCTGGVLRAIETFDASRGRAWATWATQWIRAEIRSWLATSQLGGRGVHVRQARIRRVRDQLTQALGREPEPHEIQGAFIAQGASSPGRAAIAEALAHRPAQGALLSWDELVAQPGDAAQALASDGTSEHDRAEGYDRLEQIRRLWVALQDLPPAERACIEARYGLGHPSGAVTSQPEVAAQLLRDLGRGPVSPRAVGHLEDEALRLLRAAFQRWGYRGEVASGLPVRREVKRGRKARAA